MESGDSKRIVNPSRMIELITSSVSGAASSVDLISSFTKSTVGTAIVTAAAAVDVMSAVRVGDAVLVGGRVSVTAGVGVIAAVRVGDAVQMGGRVSATVGVGVMAAVRVGDAVLVGGRVSVTVGEAAAVSADTKAAVGFAVLPSVFTSAALESMYPSGKISARTSSLLEFS